VEKLETYYANGIWLKHAEFEVNIEKLQQGHIEGTCAWFMDGENYAEWRDASSVISPPKLLWIQGKPGSGKSTLASWIIQDLHSLPQATVLYVFCKEGEENKCDVISVLRNLVFQLMEKSPKHDEFHSQVQSARLKAKTVYIQSAETLWKIFRNMLADPHPVYCVVDGLDECIDGPEERRAFLEQLAEAFNDGHTGNRLMISSRLEKSEIENSVGAWKCLQIQPADVREDIQLLVSVRLGRSKILSAHPEVKSLRTTLVEGADGMILWADLMVNELEAGHWDVQSVLRRPPQGLSGVYGNVLRRISTNKRSMIKVRRVLNLVLAAVHPLHLEELSLGLAVLEGLKSHEDYDARGDPIAESQAILRESSPLLTKMSNDTIEIVHASLRDYLFSEEVCSTSLGTQFSLTRANIEMSRVLTNYLSFDCFKVDPNVINKPLLKYASLWLTYHSSQTGDSKKTASALVTFFNITQGWRWLQRLGEVNGLSYGHLQLMQSRIRLWSQSLDVKEGDRNVLCNFLLLLAQNRYKDAQRLEGDTPSKLTLASMTYLASTYYFQGRWKEAEELDGQVFLIKKRLLGEKHTETLTSMINLASSYRNQGRWKDAETLQLEALKIMGSIYGEQDPEMLRSKANLAAIWRNQKQLAAAEALQLQVLEVRKSMLDDDAHPDILTSKANLALTYYDARKLADAEKLQEEVLKTTRKELGIDHPYTLSSMANLAATYRNKGRWREASGLGREMVEMRKKVLGEDHPYTLNGMVGYASTLFNQGKFTEAAKMQTRVTELRRVALGEEHPETLTGMGNLALTFCCQERWVEAEALQVQTLSAVQRRFDQGHPFSLICMTNLVLCYRNQGKWDMADSLVAEIETIIAKTDPGIHLGYLRDFETHGVERAAEPPGKRHVESILAMVARATRYGEEQKWTEERDLQLQIMQTRRRVIGEDHPDTLTGMANLALTGKNQAR
jgi:tetratricopeptide (TPR) repeat protein